jgi:hypothetical protein
MAYRKPISPPEPSCSSAVECAVTNPDPMALVALLAATGVFLLFVTLALAHIDTARSLLEQERTRIADEAAAFDAFARRISAVEPATRPVADGGPTVSTSLETVPGDDSLAAVREAYRETVMSVPHYDNEYDESLSTNMSLEFGDDVAGAVENGAPLTPQLKATLVERSRTARRQRASLLRQFEDEAEALDDVEETLVHCRRTAERIRAADLQQCSFDELAAEWRLVEDRVAEAETLLHQRQHTLQDRGRDTGTRPGAPTFEEYVYGPMDVTHPVLAAGAEVADQLGRARERLERALASAT